MNRSIQAKHLRFSFLVGIMTLTLNLRAQEALPLGRVVFLGDSITQAGNEPGGYVCLIRDAIQSAEGKDPIEVFGAGVSGNKVPDLQARLDRDVLALKPSTVVIYIGINDVWHSQNGQGTPKDKFSAGLREIVDRIKAAGSRVVICTPSVIGERTDGKNDLDKPLDEFAELSRAVARDTQSQLIDLRLAFVEHLKSANPEDAANGILTSDGVHLNEAGNQFVARVMLRELGHPQPDPVLRHVVLIKFKPDLEPQLIEETLLELKKLGATIDTVKDLESGTDVSAENLAQGFTHCFLLTFADAKGRDQYLQHDAHQAFVNLALPRIDKVLVFDYWTK
jgi:lysophospholipase L1-like esterase